MVKPTFKLPTRLKNNSAQIQSRQISFLQHSVRWLYRIIFVFLGTTIVSTIVQAVITAQGTNLNLSSIQGFFFVQLAIHYPVPFTLISCLILLLGIGGIITDRMLAEAEKATQTESMKNTVKESIVEIFGPTNLNSSLAISSASNTSTSLPVKRSKNWWGEIPNVPGFVGRQNALEHLVNWVAHENCRVIAVFGFGGIGKTSLVAKFAQEARDQFEFVYWRSMQNAPSFKTTLLSILQLVSNQQHIDLPEEHDEQISLLIEYLKNHRCLLVLDNWETLLREGEQTGQYKIGSEAYGELIQGLSDVEHRSCLILTSREKPRNFLTLEVNNPKVHSLATKGLQVSEAQSILANEELTGASQDWDHLIQLYGGNPLYLKLAANSIRELFGGDIGKFLATGERVFGSLQNPVKLQFNRLSALEQEVVYWLTIEREPTSIDDLCRDFAGLVTSREVLTVLETLRHRSMIETNAPQCFALQPVIMEYTTAQFIEKIITEVADQSPVLFAKHALIKARAKDYVRNSQVQLLLKPIVEQLLARFGQARLEARLKDMLVTVRADSNQQPTYMVGNILNLLIQMESDLRGYDFSYLTIRQAYLRGMAVPEINFAFSKLEECVFTDTFGGVLSMAQNPEGTLLAAGTTTGEIRLWQLPEGRPLRTLAGHTDWVMSVAFSPDGMRLISGSEDLTLRIWDIHSGQCLKILQGHKNWVRCIAVHPNGTLVASAGEDGDTKIWDLATGECLVTLPEQTNMVTSVAFSPDGKLLASGSNPSTIHIWEVATWQLLYTLNGHASSVWCVTFSPDGRHLASSSQDNTIRIWDLEQRNCLSTLVGHTDQVWSVRFSLDGAILISTSEDQTARVWETGTFELLKTLQGHTNRVWDSLFLPGNNTVLTASQDQTIRFWDLRSGQHIATLRGYTNPVNSIAFHPSSPLLAAATSERTVHIWNTETGHLQSVLRGHTRAVRTVAFSPDGSLLASGSEDRTIRLWNIETGTCLGILEGHDNWVWSVAISPSGNLLASGSRDGTVRIWDVKLKNSMTCIQVLKVCDLPIWSVAFSLDGSKLAAASGDTVARIWDVENWNCIHKLQGHKDRIFDITFNPVGDYLATASADQSVRLWEATTGSQVSVFDGYTRPVWAVAFSPDGTTLATGGADRTVQLWTVETKQAHAEFQGHNNLITSLQFSLDGQLLASSSEDGKVRLWRLVSGECLAVLSSARPYERMDITGIYGITPAEKSALQELGAIEHSPIENK